MPISLLDILLISLACIAAAVVWYMNSQLRRMRHAGKYVQSYKALLRHHPDAVVLLTPDGIISDCNSVFETMLGRESADLFNTRLTAYCADATSVNRFERSSAAPSTIDIEIRHRDSHTTPVHADITLLRNDHGVHLGTLIVLQDAHRSQRITHALQQVQRLESLAIVAGNIAHDLNNYLQAMLGNAHLALEKVPREHPAWVNIEKAITASESAAELAQRMLAYATGDTTSRERINLNTLIAKNLRVFETRVPSGVRLAVSLSPDLPDIDADTGQLHALMLHLVLNAAEAMEGHDGALRMTTGVQNVSTLDAQLWTYTAQVLRPALYVFFEVSDEGCGIEPGDMHKLFDPFYSTKTGARGIGLPLVLGIVKNHSGGLAVWSERGKGATFRVVFPLPEEKQPLPLKSEEPSEPAPSVPLSLLLVDDEELIRDVTVEILSDKGITVIPAATGEDALAIYQEHHAKIDVILLDLSMPGIGGRETLLALREINPGAKVFLSSGFAEEDATRDFAGLGLAGFIKKPYRPEYLLQRLFSAVR